MATSWPDPLPAPVIAANTATYKNVYPGVNLQLSVLDDSYTETLIVTDPAAAADPALSDLKFSYTATGVTLAATTGGGLDGIDAAGTVVFTAGAPAAWDSSDNTSVGPAPTATNPGGANVTDLAVTIPTANVAAPPADTSTGTLNVAVPAAALTGAGLTYPLYIDPSINPTIDAMAQVLSNGAPYYNGAGGFFKVGDCGTWPNCNGIGVGRAYFAFPVGGANGLDPIGRIVAKVFTAKVQAWQFWNAYGCTATTVALFSTDGGISTGTTWSNQPFNANGNLDQVSTATGGNSQACTNAGSYISFDNANVVAALQNAATQGYTQATFALVSGDEADQDDWKQFYNEQSSTTVPTLSVTFAYPPTTPNDLGVVGAINCGSGDVYVNSPGATLDAASVDTGDPGGLLYINFDVYNQPGGAGTVTDPGTEKNVTSGQVDSGWPTATLTDGNYSFEAQGHNPAGQGANDPQSAWSAAYNFTVETGGPATPTIRSFDYPENTWGALQNNPGTITVATNSATDPVAFSYNFDGTPGSPAGTCNYNSPLTATSQPDKYSGTGLVPAVGGAATITVPSNLTAGQHTLNVFAFNHAQGPSTTASYTFYVSPPATLSGGQPQPITFPAEEMAWTAPTGTYTYPEALSECSNGWQEHFTADAAGQTFTTPITVPVEGDYAIGVETETFGDYGSLSFAIDGQTLNINGTPADAPAEASVPPPPANPVGTQYTPLGALHLTAGTTYTLSVTTTAPAGPGPGTYNGSYGNSDPQSPQTAPVTITNYPDNGYSAGIDFFNVIPINDVTEASFAAAMNNHGIADDSTTPTSPPADFDSTGHNLSGQTLTAAGYAPATAVTVDNGDAYQATFTMPATNDTTATPDNIITDGQTIPLPDKPTNRVDLLVAATCGTTTYQTGNTLMNFKVNYTNGAKHPITNSLVFALPAVPDWLDGNLADASTAAQPTADGYVYPNGQYISPAATLAYQDAGTEPQTASPVAQPHLYHISLPFSLPGGYYAASLTLPDTGTTFTDGTTCGVAPALHILAIDDTNQPADQAPAINQTPSIAAGQDHTIAVQTGGTVWAWGNNTDGQLGNGTTTANPTPVQVLTANGQALTDVVSVAAGGQDSMALDNNGDVWEWGDNTDGQLGNGGIYTNDPYANQVLTGPGTPLTNVAAIAAGQYHSLAVQTNGTVWAWGSNSNGQLGDGQAGTNNSSYATPVDLPTGITITQVAAGYADSFALTNAGNLYAWGQNSSGQLGDGQNTDADLPTLITTTNTDAALPPLIAVTAHQYHVTALDTTGNVWAWGDNTDGQLGNGTIGGNTNQPTQVDSLSGVASIAVSSGGTDSIALESNGTVWDWGNGNNGALGNATTGTDSPTPVQVDLPANTNIVAITGGIDYTMALQNNGTLWGWGADQYGQIGDGTSGAGNNQDTPIQSQYTQQTTTG